MFPVDERFSPRARASSARLIPPDLNRAFSASISFRCRIVCGLFIVTLSVRGKLLTHPGACGSTSTFACARNRSASKYRRLKLTGKLLFLVELLKLAFGPERVVHGFCCQFAARTPQPAPESGLWLSRRSYVANCTNSARQRQRGSGSWGTVTRRTCLRLNAYTTNAKFAPVKAGRHGHAPLAPYQALSVA